MVVRRVFALLAAVFAAYLVLGEKPWNLGIAGTLARGSHPKLDQFIGEGLWYACAVCFVLSVILMATVRLWLHPWRHTGPAGEGGFFLSRSSPARNGFLLFLAVVTLFAAVDRWPKLGQSFGNDEEYAFRTLVNDRVEITGDGALNVRERGWKDTLFYNRASNNHIVFTSLSRISHELWRRISGDAGVSERAARKPAFIAGLVSIPLLGILLAATGGPRAGMLAACLLALHPWFFRYSTEARGYAVMLMFLLVGLLCLIAAVRTGRWRHWLGFGSAQAFMLLTFPGAIYWPLMMNLCVPAVLVWRYRGTPNLKASMGRWLVSGTVSAMGFLLLFAPSVRQLHLFMEERAAAGRLDGSWVLDFWAHLALGMRWAADDRSNPVFLSIQHSFQMHPQALGVVLALVCVAFVAGLLRSLRSPDTALLAAPCVAAAAAACAHVGSEQRALYVWYVIYVLPGVVAAVALGVDWIARVPWLQPRHGRLLANAAGAVLVWQFFLFTQYPRDQMRATPRQSIREAVAALHEGGYDPFAPAKRDLLTASIGTSARQKWTYDPRIVPLKSDDEEAMRALGGLMSEASARGVPLRVLIGNPPLVAEVAPRAHALLTGPDFKIINTLHGLESMFTYWVVEYSPPKLEPHAPPAA
jgi:hypothetical protein